jgi:hypothetical protein
MFNPIDFIKTRFADFFCGSFVVFLPFWLLMWFFLFTFGAGIFFYICLFFTVMSALLFTSTLCLFIAENNRLEREAAERRSKNESKRT